jgi:hypothetical protein
VITEACVFAILLVSLSRTAGIVTIPFAVIVRALVAGAGMAGVYIVLAQWVPWPGAALVAGAVFITLLHLLGADGPGGLRSLLRNARFDTSVVEPEMRDSQTATPSER